MIFPVSAREWNSHVRFLATRYPVNPRRLPADPHHAWKLSTQYDFDRKRWVCSVQPGSVNGTPATTPVPFYLSPQEFQQDYLRNHDRPAPGKTVEVSLRFRPSIDLFWREIGNQADPVQVYDQGGEARQVFETVPAYFLQRGVLPRGKDPLPGEEDNVRRLFAADIILSQPRPALANSIEILPGGLLGGTELSVNPYHLSGPQVARPPRVTCVSRYSPGQVPLTLADIVFQRFQDSAVDNLHLSTVYALSPPVSEAPDLQSVDERFSLQVRYFCHYNLAHATRGLPRTSFEPVRLVTALAAGVGDALINHILAFHNDWVQAVLDMFNQRSLRGSFWVV